MNVWFTHLIVIVHVIVHDYLTVFYGLLIVNIHSLCEEASVGPTVNSTRAPQLGGPTEIMISSTQDKSK